MSDLEKRIKSSRRELERIDKTFAAELDKLKKANANQDSIQELHAEWGNEHDNEEYLLDSLLSQKLRDKAQQLDVPLPERPAYDNENPDWDQNVHWYRSPINNVFVLTQSGRDYVDTAIWKKEERQHNRRIRWITLGIGLTGALTGLLSVLANNWEKFARIWPNMRH